MSKTHEPKYSTLACELAGAVRTITLNRPDRRNAISGDMIEDLLAATEPDAHDGSAKGVKKRHDYIRRLAI